jgi:hypothetical protein
VSETMHDSGNRGGLLLALVLGAATIGLVVMGTMWPSKAALAYTGGQGFMGSASTPEAAVENLGDNIRASAWEKAYDGLANKAQFTEPEFQADLTGYYQGLRSYATVDHFEVFPLHASDSDAEVRLNLYWSTVVGQSESTRDLHVVKVGDHWAAEWPLDSGELPALGRD